jgi:hypothetical protein
MNDDHGLTPEEARALRRAASCWQSNRPSAVAAARAWRRWSWREVGSPRPVSRLALVLLAVSPLVTGGALGLSGVIQWPRQRSTTAGTPQVPVASTPAPRGARRPSREPSPPSAVGSTVAEAPPRSAPVAPVQSPRKPLSDRAALEPLVEHDNSDQVGAWARAAQALRTNNEVEALSALDELGQSVDRTTRDAALLAKAQLHTRGGRAEQAAPVLRRLSESGATPLIRRRAAEVLNGLYAPK